MSDLSANKTELCKLLTTVCDWLARSEESDWAALSPPQVIVILQREINALQSGQYFENVVELTSLFCATAEIQEISMASGWSDEYLKLAARFDELIDLVS